MEAQHPRDAGLYDDGRLYDLLVGGAPTGKEAGFYRQQVEQAGGGPVLELACGTGRLTLPLAAAGLEAVGIDIAPSMLERARAKAEEQGARGVRFVHADVRDFDLGGQRFGLIFFPVNSLAHLHTLADISACFARVRGHLEPRRGRFVVDIFNPSLAILSRDPDTRFPVAEFEDDGARVTLTESNRYDAAAQVNHIRWFLRREGEDRETAHAFSMRQFFPQEIDALLESSGFAIEAKYGDFDEGPFTGASRKQVLVCRAAAIE